MLSETNSRRKQYLRLLGASSPKELEERVVRTVEQSLREQPKSGVQVRLSRVARQFKIRPRPEMIPGSYDGEITFELPPGEFVIKICAATTSLRQQRSPESRLRFTYAHEFAHRFFFVEWGNKWERALRIVTSDLKVAERMREQITLRKMEEGLCNRIARRLLIPDDFISRHCQVSQWFSDGKDFYRKLSEAAHDLGVSRDCLLLRLKDVLPRGTSHCAFVVGYSRGPITERGASKLRVVSGLFPSAFASDRSWPFYPGAEWAKFGAPAVDFVTQRLQAGRPVSSEVVLQLLSRQSRDSCVLRGFSRIVNAEAIFVWGEVA